MLRTISNPTATEMCWTISAPTSDTFYIVKLVFAKTDDSDHSYAWAACSF